MPRAWMRWQASLRLPALPYDMNRRRLLINGLSATSFHFAIRRKPAGSLLRPVLADTPFEPGRSISGFRTGAHGMGHVVLMVADFDVALAFYQDLLGFQHQRLYASPASNLFPACQSAPPQPCAVRAPSRQACIT